MGIQETSRIAKLRFFESRFADVEFTYWYQCTMKRLSITTAVVVALLFVGLSQAMAQQGAPPPPEPQEVPDIEVDDEELESIARAYITVQTITTTYRERLNSTDDVEAAKSIQQEYADVANSAIEEEGVSLERYDTVINVAGADPELRDRLVIVIEEILEDEPGSGGSDS